MLVLTIPAGEFVDVFHAGSSFRIYGKNDERMQVFLDDPTGQFRFQRSNASKKEIGTQSRSNEHASAK